MRRIAPLLLAVSLALVPFTALAHTELVSADPADGAVLTEAPDEVALTFEGEVGEGSTFTVTGPDGAEAGSGELDLDVADRNVLRGDVTVEATGEYVTAWSVVGEDGHAVEGQLSFTFDPEGEASTPDTAVPVGGAPSVPLLAGVALLLAALATSRRALAARA